MFLLLQNLRYSRRRRRSDAQGAHRRVARARGARPRRADPGVQRRVPCERGERYVLGHAASYRVGLPRRDFGFSEDRSAVAVQDRAAPVRERRPAGERQGDAQGTRDDVRRLHGVGPGLPAARRRSSLAS